MSICMLELTQSWLARGTNDFALPDTVQHTGLNASNETEHKQIMQLPDKTRRPASKSRLSMSWLQNFQVESKPLSTWSQHERPSGSSRSSRSARKLVSFLSFCRHRMKNLFFDGFQNSICLCNWFRLVPSNSWMFLVEIDTGRKIGELSCWFLVLAWWHAMSHYHSISSLWGPDIRIINNYICTYAII